MADATVAWTRQVNVIKERGGRDQLDVIRAKQEKQVENVRRWRALSDQVREATNQLYHRAEAQFDRDLAAAKQERTHAIESVNAKAEKELKEAAAAAEAQQKAIWDNEAAALAKNLRDKAAFIQNGGPTLPAVVLLQQGEPEGAGSVLSSAFAKEQLQAEEQAAGAKAKAAESYAAEHEKELESMKAEYKADQAEQAAFATATQATKEKRDAAAQRLAESTQAANLEHVRAVDAARKQY